MPLKRKMHGYLLTIIPPFDPNIQLPLCGFYESSVTGSNLLHLVNMVFFPPHRVKFMEGLGRNFSAY
jgi:hypothetical protein